MEPTEAMMFEEAGTVLMRREAIIQRFLKAGEVAAVGLSHFIAMQKIGHAQVLNSGNKFNHIRSGIPQVWSSYFMAKEVDKLEL